MSLIHRPLKVEKVSAEYIEGSCSIGFFVISIKPFHLLMNYRNQNQLQMNIVWCSIVCVSLICRELRNWDEKKLCLRGGDGGDLTSGLSNKRTLPLVPPSNGPHPARGNSGFCMCIHVCLLWSVFPTTFIVPCWCHSDSASVLLYFTFCHTCSLCRVELVVQLPARGRL